MGKAKLESVLKKYGVTVAYLFGSQTTGKTHAKSDVDIAMRFSRSLPLKKILLLANELTPLFDSPVDIVDLDSAPLPLQFRVYRARSLLYSKNPKEEVLKKSKALCLYHDYKYYYDRFVNFEIERMAKKGLA